MTREESIKTIENAKHFAYDDIYEEAFDMAIKALEQESILDKIRAEIRANSFYVTPQYGRIIREADVLHIIDKYNAETEGKE